MKHLYKILGIAILVGTIAFLIASYVQSERIEKPQEPNELTWLRGEFHLNEQQFQKIKALHDSYMLQCAKMCQAIAESNNRLDVLISAHHEVTPEIVTAIKNSSQVQNECQTSMLEYFYSVSREMNPEDGKKYLEEMKDCIIHPGSFPHPPNHH